MKLKEILYNVIVILFALFLVISIIYAIVKGLGIW